MLVGFSVCLPAATLAQSGSAVSDQRSQQSTVQGRLDRTSQQLGDSTYFNAHPFWGTARQKIKIDLTSDEFDTYLILLDPTGNKIAEGGIGTGGTNARLVVTLPATGTYTVLAASQRSSIFADYTFGRYTLTWNLAPTAIQPEDLHQAEQLWVQASFLFSQGQYKEAFPLAERALAIREALLEPNHPDVLNSLRALGWNYMAQERYAEATLLFERALKASRQTFGTDQSETLLYLDQLAFLYALQKRSVEAEEFYRESLEIKRRLYGATDPKVLESLNSLALFYADQGRSDKAERLYKQVFELNRHLSQNNASQNAIPEEQSRFNPSQLGFLYLQQGRDAEAETVFLQSLEHHRREFGENGYAVAWDLENLAKLYLKQGKVDRSLELLWQVQAIEEYSLALNLANASESNRRSILENTAIALDNKIALHLQQLPNNPAAARLAFTAILQRKGRALDFSANLQRILRQQVASADRDRLDRVFATRDQLAKLVFASPQQQPLDRYQYQTQVAALEERLRQQEDELSRRSTVFRNLSRPVTIDAIQSLIPTNAALVEFVQYRVFNPKSSAKNGLSTRYAAYVLHAQGNPKGIDLGDAEAINQSLQNFRSVLRDSNTPANQLQPPSHELEKLVMQPVRNLLGDTHTVLLSPDGNLNLIPFEALVDDTNRYLVEAYSFTYLTSGRDLLRLANSVPSQSPPVLMADPYFAKLGDVAPVPSLKAEQNIRTRTIDLTQQDFPSLPGTAQEINAIAPLLNVQPLTGSQATEEAVKQVNRPRILHIATHGFFVTPTLQPDLPETTLTDNPLLLSGLVLAGFKLKPQNREDGVLTALEVANLNLLGTQLVVLSACDTGLGRLSTGEGIYGLRRALVIAGAESQVISLWKVADDATQELIVSYYQKLLAGQGRSEALRQTQLEMLKSQDRSHPYYWASFIPSGNWQPLR
jgi:CHAT domain-containing protein/Tfp pilus assembly protein PilF